ncbi:proline-rich receptor-like protein kinase PERK2 [Iris pallida]|uniref:Proline-rich receptor-like protein kinase PERK2 n=1 Tax=Iris pallida TaxID=29817 RepID=A0AAX6G1I3_IRIPA|nr:proline-rich receptor-like protein kinase PERK2 [Iris pallida]
MLGRSHGRGGGVLDRRGRGHDGGSEGVAKGAVRFPLSYSLRVVFWGNGMDDRGGAWRTLGRSWSGLVVSGVCGLVVLLMYVVWVVMGRSMVVIVTGRDEGGEYGSEAVVMVSSRGGAVRNGLGGRGGIGVLVVMMEGEWMSELDGREEVVCEGSSHW